jgi:glycerol transport system substrate-binding protein
MAEMKWFIEAAKKLQAKGVKEISVVSETITTHEYESKTLAKAFSEITGITVKHDLIQEGDVVEKLQTSMQSGKSIYDGWISDSDLIGTHYRYGKIMNLTDYMAGAGKEYTNPGLDLKDFIGTSFTTAPDGKLYQLPDQQFANLYWFRADLFARQDLKDKFKAKYGYDLGVPLNWSAYEDIAEFFTNDVKQIDGKPIYGHMDYGKKDPSLGWRFTDAWLSHGRHRRHRHPQRRAGGRVGHPRGDDGCTPVGASVARGGATNSPAAVYALTKYVDWMKKYAPKEATGMTFGEAGPVPAQGPDRAADLLVHGLHRRHDQAGPAGGQRRRHAQVAHGARPQRPVLEAGHAKRLPGRGFLDLLQARRQPHGRGLAVRAVRHRQDDESLKKTIVGLTPSAKATSRARP